MRKKAEKQIIGHARKRVLFPILILISLWLPLMLQPVYALDIIKTGEPQSELDDRENYPVELLKSALLKTEGTYGPFQIEYCPPMTRERALLELVEGKMLNVYTAPTQPEWEEKALAVYFPIRKGLLGYRLFLITRNNLKKMADLQNVEDLKALNVGLSSQWSTTKAMKPLGFQMILGNDYEGLFGMLNLHRFDYFPRGMDEIYAEYEARKNQYPEMVIEPTKALYLALPVYYFVSPKTPHLAERIEKGLWQMREDGSFDKLFYKHFQNSITRANLKNRKVFRVNNPILSKHPIFDQPELWFEPGL